MRILKMPGRRKKLGKPVDRHTNSQLDSEIDSELPQAPPKMVLVKLPQGSGNKKHHAGLASRLWARINDSLPPGQTALIIISADLALKNDEIEITTE